MYSKKQRDTQQTISSSDYTFTSVVALAWTKSLQLVVNHHPLSLSQYTPSRALYVPSNGEFPRLYMFVFYFCLDILPGTSIFICSKRTKARSRSMDRLDEIKAMKRPPSFGSVLTLASLIEWVWEIPFKCFQVEFWSVPRNVLGLSPARGAA